MDHVISQTVPADLGTVLHHAASAVLNDQGFLRITGSDATRWLNGMVTNNVASLGPGEGNYNFLLNAQGRIQGDCLIFRDPAAQQGPEFLLVTGAAQISPLQQHLDRFIIMDDVELSPGPDDETTLLLLGPDAPAHLGALNLPRLEPLHLARAGTPQGAVVLFAPPQAQTPRFELRGTAATVSSLHSALNARGLPDASPTTLEQLRILEGTPRFGTDIRDRELPQETNQTHALHFAKGCYLGQEIVERIRSRGQVHRVFTPFTLEGSLPELPASLEFDGKPAGELTSASEVVLDGAPQRLALGYVRREALDTSKSTGKSLRYSGGVAHPRTLRRSI